MDQCKRILSLHATNAICTKLQMHFASRMWSQPQVDTILPKFCIAKKKY